jgi:hypothetical protein
MFPGGCGDVNRMELAEVYYYASLRALLSFFMRPTLIISLCLSQVVSYVQTNIV